MADDALEAGSPERHDDQFTILAANTSASCNPDQAYFWTEAWQQGEREADEDIAAGRVHDFESAAEAFEFLRRLRCQA